MESETTAASISAHVVVMPILLRYVDFQRLQSSSASRFTAGAAGFFILSQSVVRPDRYRDPSRFDTMPSSPSLQVHTDLGDRIGEKVRAQHTAS